MTDKNIARRKVLKSVAASTTAIASVKTAAAAEEEELESDSSNGELKQNGNKLKEEYNNRGQVVSLVSQSQEILGELANRNIIERASPSVFDFETKVDQDGITASDDIEGWTVIEYTEPDSVRTAHLMVSKSTNKHNLTLHILPEAEKRYALVEEKETGEEFAIDPATTEVKLPKSRRSGDGVRLMSSDCSDTTTCSEEVCGTYKGHGEPTTFYYTKLHHSCHSSYNGCRCYVEETSCSYTSCTCTGVGCP